MIVAGLKLTHDASIAFVEYNSEERNATLLTSIELEKIGNRERHAACRSEEEVIGLIEAGLKDLGLGLDSSDVVDYWVMDGWRNATLTDLGIRTSGYHEEDLHGHGSITFSPSPSSPYPFARRGYTSFPHVVNHIQGSLALSPFYDPEGKGVWTVVWDGGTAARLYLSTARGGSLMFVDSLPTLKGILYGIMGYYWGPYRDVERALRGEPRSIEKSPGNWMRVHVDADTGEILGGRRDWPGKLMAWIGHAQPVPDLYPTFDRAFKLAQASGKDKLQRFTVEEHAFCRAVFQSPEVRQYSDAQVLASIHEWLGERLVTHLKARVPLGSNVIATGGCALNIKWNSAIRRAFPSFWVPPVCNDSGSALGAAFSFPRTALRESIDKVLWSVYSGPQLNFDRPSAALMEERGWVAESCGQGRILDLLLKGNIVINLYNRAEIGPRALGNRSMLALPYSIAARDALNEAKGRESWRPVAPITFASDAEQHFGAPHEDPFMLFDHEVISPSTIPAVTHIDGTARLQTIQPYNLGGWGMSPLIPFLLRSLRDQGLPPVLCNTSANLNGSGFFPDVASAIRWGKVPYIYAHGMLYRKKEAQ